MNDIGMLIMIQSSKSDDRRLFGTNNLEERMVWNDFSNPTD
jgi:hypothetical protein